MSCNNCANIAYENFKNNNKKYFDLEYLKNYSFEELNFTICRLSFISILKASLHIQLANDIYLNILKNKDIYKNYNQSEIVMLKNSHKMFIKVACVMNDLIKIYATNIKK